MNSAQGRKPMFKVVFFLWRRPDLSRQDYLRYYEDKHSVLGSNVVPRGTDYRRSYPIWDSAADASGNINNGKAVFGFAPFDSMTEMWYEDRAACETVMSLVRQSPARDLLEEDEKRFIDREQYVYSAVDEFGVENSGSEIPTSAAIKIIRYACRAPGLSNADFRSRYERESAPPKYELLPGLVAYRRNYPVFDDPLSFIGIYSGPSQTYGKNEFAVDLIEEIWADNRGKAERIFEVLDGPDRLIDEKKSFRMIFEEHRSSYGRFMAPVASGLLND